MCMKTDSLFYRLFQERPDLVFELAELPLKICRRGRRRSQERATIPTIPHSFD